MVTGSNCIYPVCLFDSLLAAWDIARSLCYPTDPFTTLGLQNPLFDIPELPDPLTLRLLKLRRVRSGSPVCFRLSL